MKLIKKGDKGLKVATFRTKTQNFLRSNTFKSIGINGKWWMDPSGYVNQLELKLTPHILVLISPFVTQEKSRKTFYVISFTIKFSSVDYKVAAQFELPKKQFKIFSCHHNTKIS